MKSDMVVMFGRADGMPAFVFKRPVGAAEAKQFHEETGVWPIQTVDGVMLATKPAGTKRDKRKRSKKPK